MVFFAFSPAAGCDWRRHVLTARAQISSETCAAQAVPTACACPFPATPDQRPHRADDCWPDPMLCHNSTCGMERLDFFRATN